MKKTLRWKIICLNEVYKFSVGYYLTRCIFYVLILKRHYWKSKIPFLTKICEILNKRIHFFNHVNYYKVTEMYTENRARSASVIMRMCSLRLIKPSKLNFLFHLKSKNLVTLWKCNSYLQYYKIDLSFSIKLQEINLYVYKEYKTEREARQLNIFHKKQKYINLIIF